MLGIEIVNMLTVQIPIPRRLPKRVRNTDLRQNVDLLRLPEFLGGGRRMRCIPAPLLEGQLGVLGPFAANRALRHAADRTNLQTLSLLADAVAGRSVLLAPDISADVILAHGLLPWFPFEARRDRVPLLWGPGYMPEDHRDGTPELSDQGAEDDRLRSLSRGAAGIFLTTGEAVDRWNHNIATPSADRVFELPLFMPGAPRAEAVRPVQKPNGPIELLFVGRLGRHKNLPTLIAALDQLSSRHAARLTVVSDLRDGPVDLDRPFITHHRELPNAAIMELMLRAHVFVMVSTRESFGMVFVEALASGCAIVAQRRVTQLDMLGPAARYAEPGNSEELRNALDALLSENDWKVTSELSQDRYRRRFAPDVVADRFFDAADRAAQPS